MRKFGLLSCLLISMAAADEGHSKHGTAFDSGMRTKPWVMPNIGVAPFPITTKNPEVQKWYDQGNALLHSFWFEEAERAFRWCHKLEPENPMVYLGLARCGMNWFSIGSMDPGLKRFKDFLKEATKRKATASDREQMYIDAYNAGWNSKTDHAKKICAALNRIITKYPEDVEAKAQIAFFSIGQGKPETGDGYVTQVLAKNPMHPGAHHARIHNWDGVDGSKAVDSCELYGKAAPGIGHSLHMPGHIYSKIGMWHEAAIAMDSATRVELRYMNDRLALPFETWNYAHNRDYLCYIQEQLGRGNASIQGALDILNSPTDPLIPAQYAYENQFPLIRALVKFEKWNEILDPKYLPASKSRDIQQFQEMARILALVGLRRFPEAQTRIDELKKQLEVSLAAEIKKAPKEEASLRAMFADRMPMIFRVAESKLLIGQGKSEEGFRLLKNAAASEASARAARAYANDPPQEPFPVQRILGDAYFEAGNHLRAIRAYERALKNELNDGWALAGLARAYIAYGQPDRARPFVARLKAVWAGADQDLRPWREILALNFDEAPRPETMRPERKYDPADLNSFGPSNWTPFAAPELDCLDSEGNRVRLSDYRGKNVMLVFYLSDQCIHCMEQLTAVNKEIAEFDKMNTVVLAVCSASPAKQAESAKATDFKVRWLSDPSHANARRFASYDDFEGMELHSTILIDAQGRVRWKRTGGDPFGDVNFLKNEVSRWAK
ncbi:MAG: redoxin domain-containing protein [Fimbriimonadaceae bacterium]